MHWTIEVKILPIAAVSGHLYLEIFDDKGQRVRQINGFACDPVTGQQKSVGVVGDFLRAYVDDSYVLCAGYNRDNHPHDGRVIYKGDEAGIRRAIKAMEEAAVKINAQNLSYWLFTQNSNSVFMHMLDVMEGQLPIDRKAVGEMLNSRILLPGIGNHLPAPPSPKTPFKNPRPPRPGM